MTLSQGIYATRWLILDTFRQALASGIFWVMTTVSLLCILFCLSITVLGGDSVLPPLQTGEVRERLPAGDPQIRGQRAHDGVEVFDARLSLMFGAFQVGFSSTREQIVYFVQLLLAGGVADALGILLTLIWTAGFLPTFLEPGVAAVLLAKPVPRWLLLLGKFLGVLAFVLAQALVFVGGTWLALGVRTGVWNPAYLICIPMLLLHFSVFFAFSVLLAVMTRSTVACVIGSVLFWLLCWAMNFGRQSYVSAPPAEGMAGSLNWGMELGYWLLPKPADLDMLLYDALQARNFFGQALDPRRLMDAGALHPELSILTSILFTVVILVMAAYEFAKQDY